MVENVGTGNGHIIIEKCLNAKIITIKKGIKQLSSMENKYDTCNYSKCKMFKYMNLSI